MTDYQLIRSNRRTLSISIDGEGALVVRAPMRLPQREIEAFLKQKQAWILEKQALARQAAQRKQQAQLEEGAWIPFRGHALFVHFQPVPAAFDDGASLILPCDGNAAQHALKWRMGRARELLAPSVEHWVQHTGIQPTKLSFGNAGTRWGSMTAQGHLRLNAALVHLPEEMSDYVIVHELAHRVHPDHSPAFHALVRSILPEADRIRQEMKTWAYVTTLWR